MACCFGRRRKELQNAQVGIVNSKESTPMSKTATSNGGSRPAISSPLHLLGNEQQQWPGSASSAPFSLKISDGVGCFPISHAVRTTTPTSSIWAAPPSSAGSDMRAWPAARRDKKPSRENLRDRATRDPSIKSPGTNLLTDSASSPHAKPNALNAISKAVVADGNQQNQAINPHTTQSNRIGRRSTALIPCPTAPAPVLKSALKKSSSAQTTHTQPLGKGRKNRPPPINTTRPHRQKVPAVFVRESPPANAPAVRKNLPAPPPPTPASQMQTISRQSIFSITPSQYSPTASIRPVKQIEVVPVAKAGVRAPKPVTVRSPPAVARRPSEAASKPSMRSEPIPAKAMFPHNYPTQPGEITLAGIMDSLADPPSPSQSPPVIAAGAYRSPREPALRPVNPIKSPFASPEVPLTSASLSFPPNLPDYSFTPIGEAPLLSPRNGSVATVSSGLTSISELADTAPEVTIVDGIADHGLSTDDYNVESLLASPEHQEHSDQSPKQAGIALAVSEVEHRGQPALRVKELAGHKSPRSKRQADMNAF